MLRYQEKYQWQFVYLGANQDAVLEAAKINIPVSAALDYDSTNIKQALNSVASYCNVYRRIGVATFTVHDRVEALQELVTGTA